MTSTTKRNWISLAIGLLLVFCGTWSQINGKTKANEISEEGLQELFNLVKHYVESDYVDNVNQKDLMFGAIRGMLGSLNDPHTRFMTPEEFSDLTVETSGKFGGVGIEISIRNNVLTIVSPIDGTPGMKVGLKPNDVIIEIEGKPTKNISLREAVKRLRGKPGTSVNISIFRKGENEKIDFDIVREIIKIKVVESEIVKGNLGYIRLKQFNQNAVSEMQSVLQDFKEKKVKGMILDLRWNPGGLLSAAHKVANFFIKEGIIVQTRGRRTELEKKFFASPKFAIADKIPLVVLVNEGSASASEIVTGAIKDTRRGTIVGVKTFGKGSVQQVIELRYNTGIALTMQKYYTPSNLSIHKKGIKPDVEVKFPELSKQDRRILRTFREDKTIEKYVQKNPDGYNKKNLQKFRDQLKNQNIKLDDYSIRSLLKAEYNKNKPRILIDLDFDVQLKKAFEVLKNKITMK